MVKTIEKLRILERLFDDWVIFDTKRLVYYKIVHFKINNDPAFGVDKYQLLIKGLQLIAKDEESTSHATLGTSAKYDPGKNIKEFLMHPEFKIIKYYE